MLKTRYSVRPLPVPVASDEVGLQAHPPVVLRLDQASSIPPPGVRVATDVATIKRAIVDHLVYTCGREPHRADLWSLYKSLSLVLRDRLLHSWIETRHRHRQQASKRIYYLSAEFLLGRTLVHNLINTELYDVVNQALIELGLDLPELIEQAEDPGLGNGGLGRLAACFLDSMATLGYAGYGYGIRYEFGSFEQRIVQGWQRERADGWLRYGDPWEVERHEFTTVVEFGGRVEESVDDYGRMRHRWVDTRKVLGLPHDTLISGYGNGIVNTLRLWAARASRELDLSVFNDGDYRAAVEEKILSESISKVLYPDDRSWEGKLLRLRQQYFFTACSIWDIVRRFKLYHGDFTIFADKVAIQLNDTHPSIAVAELMRVLVDVERLPWDTAWDITRKTIAFTNHTLLPEALECWPATMFETLLPRHLQIIYEINQRFLQEIHLHYPNDLDRLRRMSIIQEDPKQVRMAHLAVVGSHSINGVSKLHTELVKEHLFKDFYDYWPERFNNKTNGVTPRRWLLTANPGLSALICDCIGTAWKTDLEQLSRLADFVDDSSFRERFARIKHDNKEELAGYAMERIGVTLPSEALFSVHAKRIHEYKRQLLTALYVVHLYLQAKNSPSTDQVPRVFVFSGKAAPGYAMAKLHVKLINDLAAAINWDPDINGKLRVVFLENYSVSLAELILPAADLSLQISVAGAEASGTGNMKMALNGALTLGTLDGANIEILEAVGAEHFLAFGLDVSEVLSYQQRGNKPREWIERSPALKAAIELIASGFFCRDDRERFEPIVRSLYDHDPYLVCADFDAFVAANEEADRRYLDPAGWYRSAALNVAHMGRFSSDLTVGAYADEIWQAKPLPSAPLPYTKLITS